MENNVLAEYLYGSSSLCNLTEHLNKQKNVCADGISSDAKSAFLTSLARKTGKRVMFVSERCPEKIPFLAFERLELRGIEGKSRDTEYLWLKILLGDDDIVGIHPCSLMRKMMPAGKLKSHIMTFRPGMDISPKVLTEKLFYAGYERTDSVYSPGQYASRGEIMDIFSPCHEYPVRIVFFDTEIESIKYFEPESRRTTGEKLDSADIFPASLYIFDKDEQSQAISYFSNYVGEDTLTGTESSSNIYSIEQSGSFVNADSFYGSFAPSRTVFDYFKDAVVVFDGLLSVKKAIEKYTDEFLSEHEKLYSSGESFYIQKDALFSIDEILSSMKIPSVDLNGLKKNSVDFGMRSPALFAGNLGDLAQSLKDRTAAGWTVHLCVGGKAESLSKALIEFNIIAPVNGIKASVNSSSDWMLHGCEIPNDKVLFLGEGDIYTSSRKSVQPRRRQSEKSDEEIFAELKVGDIVVHEIQGKGRYLGLKTMEAAGSIGEYLEIEYRDGDRLYIPSSQISRIQKYIGSEDGTPQLSKLGSREWENAKYKARESVKKLAFDLVKLYSDRHCGRGYMFSPDTVWQSQFEQDCDYELTEGQDRSIKEIKADMESPKVMDRLVLGDVGYGKTEVAMRAAFKAVMDSKQVCVLVPTTLLARQHGKTFTERFDGFPVTVEILSRYSSGSQKSIFSRLEKGEIDILIGTHKLLSDKVKFRNLGLLIIDEEQRFGVAHKEKIKLLKQSVDVITLSATPIPRTLEMSLIGVRDLSMIKTPPVERKETVSYVIQYSESLVQDAVRREIARGGQVYFTVRQVQQIPRIVSELQRLVPEARVDFAHGQMSSSESEKSYGRFLDHETDVLVCTTIIESGIDIPSVNTIIIYEADKFGLAQLYQLRGRVGRSDRTAYAYFTFLSEYMGENAKKRLDAIKEFTSFGSGFKIAMRDLQIRGAGNLLGPEQSGHMMNIGYSLYCKMMKQAVDSVKNGETEEEEIDSNVNLGIPAFIPSGYITDDAHKLDIYRRIAAVQDIDDGKKTAADLADVYGALPQEVTNLIICSIVRKFASDAGIASVIKKADSFDLIFDKNVSVNFELLMNFIHNNRDKAVFRPTEPPAVAFRGSGINSLLAFLNGLKHCK